METNYANTVFIIGGASRSGKSILADMLQVKKSISVMKTDILQAVILKKKTDQELEQPDDIYTFMQPYIKTLIGYQLKYSKYGFAIEGDIIKPKDVHVIIQFTEKWKQKDESLRDATIKPVFLGYPTISFQKKLDEVHLHRKQNYLDWTNKFTEEEIAKHVKDGITYSKDLQHECHDLGLTFIDTSFDFEDKIQEAFDFLTK